MKIKIKTIKNKYLVIEIDFERITIIKTYFKSKNVNFLMDKNVYFYCSKCLNEYNYTKSIISFKHKLKTIELLALTRLELLLCCNCFKQLIQ